MTILVLFHHSSYRNFKAFYTQHLTKHYAGAFPRLTSYNRFVELQRDALVPLWCYLHTRFGDCTGISFVDATTLAVCHNLRIPQHKVFADCAQRGKSSMGWFYGFKLHLVINECGELLGAYLTPGNTDDRVPVPRMVEELWGNPLRRPWLHLAGFNNTLTSARLATRDEDQTQHEEPLAFHHRQIAAAEAVFG